MQALSSVKLSKLVSEYTDHLKCLECCKYFIAPANAACGHTLCHTCWRIRRTCPLCACSLDRKSLKLNLPLQNLTNHIQTLGETFEKLFKIKLDNFSLDTSDPDPDEDPVKNVKDWLTSSQNHFSAPIQNSESFSQESQQPHNPLEISASNIIVHTGVKKTVSPPKVTKITYVPQAQEDWDKIEILPDVEVDPKHKENIVGPMDIEPFNVNENEYTTDNPRRSSRKRDMKCDDSNQITHELSNKHNSRDSSLENDKKSQKGKQTWNNVKRMRKEFSKLNKKNRGKLNVSIEMVKKNQTVKPVNTTPPITPEQVLTCSEVIYENTPNGIERQNDTLINESDSNPTINNHNANVSRNLNKLSNDKSNLTQLPIVSNSGNISLSKPNNTHNATNNDNCMVSKKVYTKDLADVNTKNDYDINEKIKIPFIKKSALCPKKVAVTLDNAPLNVPEQETISGASDDIEISIKIGTTITNILIKKKNDMQVKINTDCEVQTSLSPQNLDEKKLPSNHRDNKISPNTDSNRHEIGIQGAQPAVNINKSVKSHVDLIVDKSTSEKKNTASAETATAQFEITASVEKELSNDMEYETAEGQKEIPKSMDQASKEQQGEMSQQEKENLENLDELHDLDIFSGSVKEPNVQILKENAPSEILVSTVCSKLKTQRVAEKRTRESTEEETLLKNKKAKANSPQMINDKTTLPDSEPINYDIIMGQVFANIDADMEQMKKSQALQSVNDLVKTKSVLFKSRDLSQAQKTQIMKQTNQSSEVNKYNLPENINDKHSENIFTILEKDDDHSEAAKNYKEPQQVQELLTPVLCQNLDLSQESQVGIQMTHKSNKKSQDIDDSDRSVVEETPQKDISHPKGKRASNNLSQVSLSETKKLPSKVSGQSIRSIICLTDTENESNDTKDVSIVETEGKKLTLETPPTISKFASHVTYKSTPVAGKLLNFDKDNENNDPEQTLCPTSEVIASTTQEKEFMTKAFESTPPTSTTRPQVNTNMPKINKSYCLAASRLTPNEILKVKMVCTERKWTYVNNYSKDITHLVVSVDEENKSQRSVKYMCALADSKWIVSFAWIEQCLQNKDIVDEEQYEALDSFGEPGPRRSRMAKQKLFQGIKFYCMPPFSVLDVDTLKNMLTAAGGDVVKQCKEVRVIEDSHQPAVLLAEPENTQEDRFIYLAMEHSIVPVNFEWVLNCLGSYTLLSIQDLLLCPSTLLPKATARWPEVLLAQDIDNE